MEIKFEKKASLTVADLKTIIAEHIKEKQNLDVNVVVSIFTEDSSYIGEGEWNIADNSNLKIEITAC